MQINGWDSNNENEAIDEIKTIKKRIIWVFIGFLMFCVVCLLIIPGYFVSGLIEGALCGNQIINRQENLNQTYDFVIFERDCGATTDYSYQLSILKHGENLKNKAGNIYITDSPFTAEWTSKNTLKINGATTKAYKRESQYKGIRILYE